MGAIGVAAFRGDLVLARAARKAGIPFVLSGSSLVRLERLAAVNPSAWFQMYASQEADENAALLDRVEASGIATLVVTVDVPVGGNREADLKNGYSSPLKLTLPLMLDAALHPRWLLGTFCRTLVQEGLPHFENFGAGRAPMLSLRTTRTHRRDNLTWEWLGQIRERWKGRLVLKGVLDAEDAALAAGLGVDGLIVSNHGGRQLDGTLEPLTALHEIAARRGPMEILFDSGVRRGTDVLKAIGLGASMALIGRPFLFAAAVGGDEGVQRAISLLRAEVDRDLALLGCVRLEEVATRMRSSADADRVDRVLSQ
jgi:L-lactate dehydrogenase (cytochrome)